MGQINKPLFNYPFQFFINEHLISISMRILVLIFQLSLTQAMSLTQVSDHF